ncbi:MAG: hypothetical protein GY778_04480, partial [bacterium]|nr:hypothetical protein [bacterium]
MALTTVQNYSLRPVYTSFVPPKGDKGDPIPVMFPAGFRNDEGGVTAGILRVDDDILAHLRKTIPAVKEAFDEHPDLENLLLHPYFQQAVGAAQQPWREVVATAARRGVPTPAFAAALAYYDGY